MERFSADYSLILTQNIAHNHYGAFVVFKVFLTAFIWTEKYVFSIFLNFLFCVSRKKESHTGFKRH